LLPKFDDKMKEAYEEYQTTLESIEKEFMDSTEADEEVILGERFYEKIKEKVSLETYKIKRLKMHQILFSELSLMLARINYMEMGGGIF